MADKTAATAKQNKMGPAQTKTHAAILSQRRPCRIVSSSAIALLSRAFSSYGRVEQGFSLARHAALSKF
jgi:hypothetical protein